MHRREFHRRVAAAVLTGGVLGSSRVSGQAAPAPAAEDKLPIIDTHQHLWDLDRQRVPWIEDGKGVLGRSYRISDYVETTRPWNVVKAIYMEIDVAPSDHVAEVELITELCRSGKYPTVAAVIGGRPGEAPFADYIRTQAKNTYVRGVRQVLHGATPRGYCLQETFVESMKLLGKLGLSFDICVRPDELPDAVELVSRCPETGFIVDHCGNAERPPRRRLEWPAVRGRRRGRHDPDQPGRARLDRGNLGNVPIPRPGRLERRPVHRRGSGRHDPDQCRRRHLDGARFGHHERSRRRDLVRQPDHRGGRKRYDSRQCLSLRPDRPSPE